MSRIVIQTGQGPPEVVALPHEGVFRLGTSPSCDLTLDDPDVSAVCCALKCTGGKVALIVTDPAAEVYVNERRTRKRLLIDGDRIRIGQREIRVHLDGKDPFVGRTIAGYRIEKFLGKGAMGTVYRAKQISLDRTVALKILPAKLGNDGEFVRAFLREARAVAKLSHPKVVHVHDAGQEEGRFYFSMEYLPGGTLEDRLRKEGSLPLVDALRYARDAAEALAWAEQHGIVHRDVKPGNLLLAADGTVKLGDLGVAVDLSAGWKQSRKAGSPAYMAPEQTRLGPIDHRADVYGLGSTLFHLLSGKLPFAQTSTAEMIRAKVAKEPLRLESVLPDAPPEVSTLIRKMLARDPERRYPTCAAMLEAIEKVLVAVTGGSAETRPPRPRSAVSSGRQKRTPRVASLTAIALAVIAVGFGVRWWLTDASSRRTRDSDGPGAGVVGSRPEVASRRESGGGAEGVAEDGRPPAAKTGDPIDETDRDPQPESQEDLQVVVRPQDDEPPAAVPAIDPEAEKRHLSVLKELGAIRRKWLAGVVESRKALQLIGEFQKTHPEPVYGESIADVLREIGEKVKAETGKRVQLDLDTVIKPLLEGAEYGRARELLGDLEKRYPAHADVIEGEVEKLDAAAADLWTRAATEVDGLVRDGGFQRGRGSLVKLREQLPPAFSERVLQKIAAVDTVREEYWRQSAALHGEELRIEAAISRAADEVRIEAPGASFGESASGRILARRWDLVLKDIERCTAAWSRLNAGVEHLAERNRIVRLRAANQGEDEAVPARLRALREETLSFRTTEGSKTHSVELLSLCDENLLLLALAGLPGEGSGDEGDAIESLGALLLWTKGPLRAAGVLSDSRIAKARRDERERRLEVEVGHFLGRRVHALSTELKELSEASSGRAGTKNVDAWKELARGAITTIGEYRATQAYRRWRNDLTTVYLEAGAYLLRQEAPASLFHATRVRERSGSISINYRFQDEAELLDFRQVGAESGGRIALGEAGLRVSGEYRLLRGNPFRDRIVVEARVRADRYDGAAPNINVALWTHDRDRVSATSGGTAPDREASEASADWQPGDYVVFGLGYHVSSGTLSVAGSGGREVATPADVLMGGKRGAPLGTFRSMECVWASSVSGRKRNQALQISMTSNTLIWKVNGEKRSMTSRQLDRFFQKEPRTGSLTLFTNGSEVEYSSLTVTGVLNPSWVEEEIRVRVVGSLREVEPDYPFDVERGDPGG